MLRVRLFILLLFASTATAWAQHSPFLQVTPQPPPGCLFPFQDSRGRLWLAGCETGAEGIFYFDGTRFVSPLKSGFPNAIVRGMAEDSEGGIWFSSTAGIFRLYKGRLEKIVSGVAEAGIERIAPDVFLAAVGTSANEATATADAVRIGKTADGWKAQPIVMAISQVQFRLDASGHILYGCNGGYCELQRDEVLAWRGGSPISVIRRPIPGSNDYANSAALVLRDHSGCVWLKNSMHASYQCATDAHPVPVPASLGYPSMLELPDGSIVISSITRMTIGRPGHFRVLAAPNGYPGSARPVVDKSGNLWVVCRKGLFYLPWRMGMEFWSESEGLEGEPVSLLRLNGKLFAIAGESLEVLEANRRRWRVLANLGDIGHLAQGPHGTIMASSATRGVLQISQDGRILRRSIAENVSLIRQGKDGKLWAVGGNVWSVHFNSHDVQLQPQFNEAEGVGRHALKFDLAGSPWVCYGDGLLYRRGSEWISITRKQGLAVAGCASLAVEPEGDVWYADYILSALYRIHQPKSVKPEIREYQSGGGIGIALATFFETDHRGWLWRGSSDGIHVADYQQAKQGEWLRLGSGDGLPAGAAKGNSFLEDADGSVWYCADTSVIHFYPPDDLVHPKYAPSVFLSTFSSSGEAPQAADFFSEIKSGTDLRVQVGSLQIDRRNAVRMSYRLLPEQSAWKPVRDFDLRLGRLHWGAHTLQVKAQLNAGPWSEVAEQTFTILRPVWLTWPYLLGYLLTGSGLAGGQFRWRRKRRERAAKLLPELAEWRLAALSPELGQLGGTLLDGRFEVGNVLARGGFATVVRGRDIAEGGRACAIKLFRQELMDKEWMARRFHQEVRALAKIAHPNVVSIHSHGATPAGFTYLVMEFIDGHTLREVLEEGCLAPLLTASYLRQIGAALDVIHAHGICHRDLKPENLMIRHAAEWGRELVLIDFSIAIVKDPDETLHGLSRAAGTIYYMAPEQAIGYADASTDIYSLAKILIEMLTGKRLSELLPAASMDLPERVRELLARLPLELSSSAIEIVASALEFDPGRRPKFAGQFADQIADDLEQVASRT